MSRTIVGNNDGGNLFGSQASGSTDNNSAPSTYVFENEASNLPFKMNRPITVDQIPVSNANGIFENVDIASLALGDASVHLGDLHFVAHKDDLPTPVGGIITLGEDQTYFFTSNVDLTGDRLVASNNTCIIGASSENAFITSTGLAAGQPLLYSEYTIPVRHISIHDVDTGIHLNGLPLGGMAVDWTGVNFVNVPNVGLVDQVDNFIWDKGTLISSNNFRFAGTIGTVALNNSLFTTGSPSDAIIKLESTLNITRRFRVIYSSFVAWATSKAVEVDAAATIPNEGFILDTLNFAGGSPNYLSGIDYLDNRSRFKENRGITNTAHLGGMYTHGNTLITDTTNGVVIKANAVTSPMSVNQRFDHDSSGRLTYTGAFARDFEITITTSIQCPTTNQQIIGVYAAINGVPISESEMYSKTSSTAAPVSQTNIYITELQPNDYVEVWIENDSSNHDLIMEFMTMTIKAFN